MRYGLLGPVEVRASAADPPAELGSPLQRVLLGLLLTERDRSVSLDRIVDELWGDAPPADPEGSVHTYVSRLRRVLEPGRGSGEAPRTLLRTPAGYRLAVPADDVDAERFAALAATASDRLGAGDGPGALAAADEALALWRSPVALEDAGDRDFAVAARTRLDTIRLTCLEDRLAALLALGRPGDVVPEAEALVARHPLRERPWVLLVDALRAVGRTADALARYTEAHRLLDEELGIAPGPALRAAQARALRAGDEPVPAVEAPSPARPGLVGRDRELALLAGVLSGDGPRFVLVDGEPGIGKSRLVAEATAAATGARVAWGRCHEDDDAPALWPWRQVLAALTGDPEAVLAGPDDGAFAAFERMLRALVDASADRRVVVVLDDLHWADPASLRLLSFLAVELQHGPVTVLSTSRPVDDDPVVAQVRATLARTARFVHIDLGPLDEAATAELVATVAGPDLDDRAVADLHDRSGGNPFFATELARVLAEGRDGPVPPGVRDVVLRRLAHLPEDARTVLRLAAVAGQRFDVPLLQRAGAGPDDDALADALEAAEAAHLVRAEGPGRMAFAHALVRESLLADLPELRRSRLHARLAAALTTGDPFERAHHLVAGLPFTDTATTVAACAEAAEQAAREHAHENAARWWERALTALDTDPGGGGSTMRQGLLLRAGTSLARAGSWEAATELLSATIDAALARRDPETAGAAAEQFCRLAGIWFPVAYGTYPEDLVGRLEAVLAATGEDDAAARVRALSALATACIYGPDRTRPAREADRRAGAGPADRPRRPADHRRCPRQLSAAWVPGEEDDAADHLDRAARPRRRPRPGRSRRPGARPAGECAAGAVRRDRRRRGSRRRVEPRAAARTAAAAGAVREHAGGAGDARRSAGRRDGARRPRLRAHPADAALHAGLDRPGDARLHLGRPGLPGRATHRAAAGGLGSGPGDTFITALALLEAGQPGGGSGCDGAERRVPAVADAVGLALPDVLAGADRGGHRGHARPAGPVGARGDRRPTAPLRRPHGAARRHRGARTGFPAPRRGRGGGREDGGRRGPPASGGGDQPGARLPAGAREVAAGAGPAARRPGRRGRRSGGGSPGPRRRRRGRDAGGVPRG